MSANIPFLAGLTQIQLYRLWRSTQHRMYKDLFLGYQPYGVDWPTLRMISPSWHSTLRSVSGEIQRRTNV